MLYIMGGAWPHFTHTSGSLYLGRNVEPTLVEIHWHGFGVQCWWFRLWILKHYLGTSCVQTGMECMNQRDVATDAGNEHDVHAVGVFSDSVLVSHGLINFLLLSTAQWKYKCGDYRAQKVWSWIGSPMLLHTSLLVNQSMWNMPKTLNKYYT